MNKFIDLLLSFSSFLEKITSFVSPPPYSASNTHIAHPILRSAHSPISPLPEIQASVHAEPLLNSYSPWLSHSSGLLHWQAVSKHRWSHQRRRGCCEVPVWMRIVRLWCSGNLTAVWSFMFWQSSIHLCTRSLSPPSIASLASPLRSHPSSLPSLSKSLLSALSLFIGDRKWCLSFVVA